MQNILTNKIARVISTVFVPPSFTIIIYTYFAFRFETEVQKIIITILVAFIFGFVLQIALFVFLRNRGKLVDLDASVKEERTVPFLISVLFYTAGLFILIFARINIISIGFWFCYISNTLIVILINKKWKISVHAAGAAGPAAALTFVLGATGLWTLILLTLVGWSRIKLKCHSLSQVSAGALLGFGSAYFQIYLIYHWFGHG